MTKRFGLDVDGVLYQFQKTALYMLNSMKGYDLKLEDWTAWNWPKTQVKNNDWQWLWSQGVQLGLFRYGHLYKGSIEGVRALSLIGDVVIITHRTQPVVQDTLDWLAYLKLPFTETHILTEGQPKSGVKCDLYVDDKPENAIDISDKTGKLTLLWERPWNIHFEWPERPLNVVKVSSWEEVLKWASR